MNPYELDEATYFYSDTLRPTLSGTTGEFTPGTRVYLDIGGKQYLANHDPVTGRYSWTPDFDISDGIYNFSIRVVDRAGNSSKPLLRTLIVDTLPPEAPVLLNLYDDVPPVEGSFDPGASIDDPRPTMKGLGQPDTLIYLRNEQNVTIGSAKVDKRGYWELEPERDLSEGEHRLHLVIVENFGGRLREGIASEPFSFTITPMMEREARIDHASDDVGPVQGKLSNGDTTDDSTPTLHGTGAATAAITLRYRSIGGAWINKTLTTDQTGHWQYTPSPALPDSVYVFQVRQSNGSWGSPFMLLVETASDQEATIEFAEDNVGPEQTDLSSGAKTDDTTPTLHGYGPANTAINVRYRLGSGAWTTQRITSDQEGSWEFTPAPALDNGSYTFQVQKQGGSWSADFSLIIDTSMDARATIAWVTDDAGPVQGDLSSGSKTDDTTPTLHGFGPGSATLNVRYRLGAGAWTTRSVKTDENGNWQFTPSPALSNGDYTFQVKKPGASWDSNFSLTVDTTLNGEVLIEHAVDNVGPVQGNLSSGSLTDDSTPTLQGTGPALIYIQVRYRLDSSTWVTDITGTDADGRWSWTPPAALADGSYTFQVKSTSEFIWSKAFTLYVQNLPSPPHVPVIVDAFDDVGPVTGIVRHNGSTDDSTPTIRGTGMAGEVIYLRYRLSNQSWFEAGSTTVDVQGKWSITSPAFAQDGTWDFEARASKNGEESAWSNRFWVKYVAPLEAKIDYAYDNAGSSQGSVYSGGSTDDTTPTLHGSGPANASLSVRYRLGSGGWISKSITADSAGSWSWTAPTLANGHYTFQVQKPGGSWSSDFTLNVDVALDQPHTPTIVDAYDDVGPVTGVVQHNGSTDDSTPTIRGTGTAGEVIHLRYRLSNQSWFEAGSTTVDARGNWSITSPKFAQNGTWDFEAKASKNGEETSWSNRFWVKYAAPVEAVIDHAVDNTDPVTGNLSSGASTDDTTPTLYGSGPANAAISVRYKLGSGGWISKSITVDSAGSWSWTAPTLGNGTYTFQVQKPGGSWSSDFTLNIDVALDKPHTPTIVDAFDDVGPVTGVVQHNGSTDDSTPTIRGTGTAGEVIHLRYRLSNQSWFDAGSTTVDARGNWSITSPKFAQNGTWDFEAKASKNGEETSWSNRFWVKYAAPVIALKPVIEGYSDDVGSVTGNFGAGSKTDDNTPTLFGSGRPGSIVYVNYGRSGVVEWDGTGSVKVGENGQWRFTAPTFNKSANYVYEAWAKDGDETSSKSPRFRFDVELSREGDYSHLADFENWSPNDVARLLAGNNIEIDDNYVLSLNSKSAGKYVSFATNDGSLPASFGQNALQYNHSYTSSFTSYIIIANKSETSRKSITSIGFDIFLPNNTPIIIDLKLVGYDPKTGVVTTRTIKLTLKQGENNIRFDDINETYNIDIHSAYLDILHHEKQSKTNGIAFDNFSFNYSGDKKTLTALDDKSEHYDNLSDSIFESDNNKFLLKGIVNLNHPESYHETEQTIENKNINGNKLVIDIESVLQQGEKNIFIDDARTQLVIIGEQDDAIQLAEILPENSNIEGWVQQQGNITVAGIQYKVYTHDKEDAELLVQQGVKTEFI